MSVKTNTELSSLAALPDQSRVWIFTTAVPLTDDLAARVEAGLKAFVADWMSHGQQVRGGFALCNRRFILVAADETANDVSGCSIDSMFRAVQAAVGRAGVPLADTADIAYRGPNGVELVDRPTFRRLVREGVIRPLGAAVCRKLARRTLCPTGRRKQRAVGSAAGRYVDFTAPSRPGPWGASVGRTTTSRMGAPAGSDLPAVTAFLFRAGPWPGCALARG